MKYKIHHRWAIKGLMFQWKRWGFIYIVTFILSTVITPASEVRFFTIKIFDITIETGIPFSYVLDLTYLAMLIIFTLILFLISGAIIRVTLRMDAANLKTEILSKAGQFETLFGEIKPADLKQIESETPLNFWELLFLRNYIRFIESGIRQSTRAPDDLHESFSYKDVSLLFDFDSVDPPFTKTEYDIFINIIHNVTTIPLWKRVWYRFFPTRISIFYLLARGISYRDYQNGTMIRLGSFLKALTQSVGCHYNLFTLEEIKNIVRLADKKFDLNIYNSTDRLDPLLDYIDWTILWDESKIKLKNGSTIQLFELSDSKSFEITLGKKIIRQKPDAGDCPQEWQTCIIAKTRISIPQRNTLNATNAVSPSDSDILERSHNVLLLKNDCKRSWIYLGIARNELTTIPTYILKIKGYDLPKASYSTEFEQKIIESLEFLRSTEILSRRHRLDLASVFDNSLHKNEVSLLDVSNLLMAMTSFVSRQNTIAELVAAIKSGISDDVKQLLLRVNALPMILPSDNERFIVMNEGRTLATSGFLGLQAVPIDIRDTLANILSNDQLSASSSTVAKSDESHIMDIPQFTRDLSIKETMPSLAAAKKGVLGWKATGGGAWIITQGLVGSFGCDESRPFFKEWLIFFDSPFQEKVFLEILTHQNYHYAWEILRNRIDFQIHYRRGSKGKSKVHLLWSREPFQAVGSMFHVDDSVRDIFSEKTCIDNLCQDFDICIMQNRLNQLIRGPVNSVTFVFAERSKKLSPIPSITYDFFLRQRMFDLISRSFSSGDILKSGELNDLCYRINWLRPLSPWATTINPDFYSHSFSNPTTWNQPGFLDLIVKEAKCAYSLIRIMSLYMRYLNEGEPLPFKIAKHIREAHARSDLIHLRKSYDYLCDFMTGTGEFSNVYAIAEEHGYLSWVRKVLSQIDDVGDALGAIDVFRASKAACLDWYTKLRDLLDKLGDPMASDLHDLVEEFA